MMIHVIGAGLSGLSAALTLTDAGHSVSLYEASGQAGGRFRSYHDPILGCEIDNGNHILIEANKASRALIERLGASDHWQKQHSYSFMDLQSHANWRLKAPFWLPKIPLVKILPLLRLLMSSKNQAVTDVVPLQSFVMGRMLAPMCVSALNTAPEHASAQLMRNSLLRALFFGAAPLVPIAPLNDALIAPLLSSLKGKAEIYYRRSLKKLVFDGDHVSAMQFAQNRVELSADDAVLLAVPAHAAGELMPELEVPNEYESIINGHFACDLPERTGEMIGITNGVIDWVFVKRGVLSTTTSAASRHTPSPSAETMWRQVCEALEIDCDMPPHRIVTEKRATFHASPAQLRRRPSNDTPYANLTMAGDCTETSLPASIEGAVRSGQKAAELLLGKA